MKKLFFISVSLVFIFSSCGNNQPKNVATQANETTSVDADLLKQAQIFFKALPATAEIADIKMTPEKVSLGKMLYYDSRLSKKGNNSCNSCHNLNTFGVDNEATSVGDEGKRGGRNSPTTLNAALHFLQFWDGRAKDVEEQAGMPIMNPVEMNIPSKVFLEKKLIGIDEYKKAFAAAFPESKSAVTYDNLQKAIGAFERTLITPSRFDHFLNGDSTALNTDEKKGLSTFIASGCTTCHTGMLLGGSMFQKFGLVNDYRPLTGSKVNDDGRKAVTKKDEDKDMFKVPSLRNITKTNPYFHDGSVNDINKAVQIMAKAQLNKDLNDEEIKSIVSFLESLTGEVPADAKIAPQGIATK
ncbi:MAG: cytochrome-c peroxidase [Bacteroidota bacterium]